VLNEYYVTVTQKLKPGLDANSARADIKSLFSWNPISVDNSVIEVSWLIQDRYGFSWWDSLIVSAAQKVGCSILLSEDLQHEQNIDGIVIINPFLVSPSQII
jgi:predicted nucleic acid-binding protein